REGLGDPDQPAVRRLGRSADPWLEPARGDAQCPPAAVVARRRARHREDARRLLPLSAIGRRADVGVGGGATEGGGTPGAVGRGGGGRPSRGRARALRGGARWPGWDARWVGNGVIQPDAE